MSDDVCLEDPSSVSLVNRIVPTRHRTTLNRAENRVAHLTESCRESWRNYPRIVWRIVPRSCVNRATNRAAVSPFGIPVDSPLRDSHPLSRPLRSPLDLGTIVLRTSRTRTKHCGAKCGLPPEAGWYYHQKAHLRLSGLYLLLPRYFLAHASYARASTIGSRPNRTSIPNTP